MTESGAIRLHRILNGQSEEGSVEESPPQARTLDRDLASTLEGVSASNGETNNNDVATTATAPDNPNDGDEVFGTPKQHKQRVAEPESASKVGGNSNQINQLDTVPEITSPKIRDLSAAFMGNSKRFEDGYDTDGELGPFLDAIEDEGPQDSEEAALPDNVNGVRPRTAFVNDSAVKFGGALQCRLDTTLDHLPDVAKSFARCSLH